MITVSLIQYLLFYCILSFSGTVERLDRDNENLLKESNSKRAVYLETEMLNKWNNMSNIIKSAETACRKITSDNGITTEELLENKTLRTQLLEEISGEMLSTMRINSVNGVFAVLANSSGVPDRNIYGGYDGIYFNDGDTHINPADYSDVILARGPKEIANNYNLPLDIRWRENFENSDDGADMEFFFTPVEAAYSHQGMNSRDLGLWDSLLYHYPNAEYGTENIITYSEPIIVDGCVIGTTGIALSIEHITTLIAPGKTMNKYNGFYFLAQEIDEGKSLVMDGITGDADTFYENQTIFIENTGVNSIFRIQDKKIGGSQAYCTLERLNLYGENSPYGGNAFVVGAAMNGDDLYRSSAGMRKNLLMALVLSVIIGTSAMYFTARLIVKPIKKLAENVEKASYGSAIDIVDTEITEIHELSVTLNDLNSKNAEYRDELIAERERYIIALSSTSDRIVEYDCVNDIFFIHYFIRTKDGGTVKLKRFENFRRLIEDGKICPEDGVPAMLNFISTDAADNGSYIKVFANGEPEKFLWFYSKGKAIYDGSRLIRVIASSKDVTAEKELEQRSLEKKRRNRITGFYNNEYGNILMSRFMVEMRNKTSVSAVVTIVQFSKFFNKYGTAFCDAVLEEAAVVIRKNIPEEYTVFHGGKSEFLILTPMESREEARSMFRKIIDGIENIYGGDSAGGDESDMHIDCAIGVCFCKNGNGVSLLRRRLKMAAAASVKFREEFNGIVFEDEVSDREAFIQEYDPTEQEKNLFLNPESAFENSNIVAFAFNIFEKTSNFNAALYAFMRRAGRELDLERILIFELNPMRFTMKIIHQWNSPEMAPIEVRTYSMESEKFQGYMDVLRSSSFIHADKAAFDKDAYRDRGRMTGNGAAISVPMFDNDNIIGCMTYELSTENAGDELIACLKELTTIVSAYISKSGAVRESRAKSEFLSKMSHEIRTPMNAIIGMTDIALSTEEGTPAINNYLEKIDSSSHYLLSLINDILDMSRIENGKMTTEETYINLEKIITQIYDMIRIQTENKGIWLRLDKDIKHPHLLGDPLKLNQILVNVLGNAVKFTSKGGITLSVKETSCSGGTANIFFSVKDTGIGISEENQGRIFNSFEQADEKTMRKYGGTGLGLAISSSLVRLLGGRLEVNSIPDKGSEFYFTLAMKITDPAEEEDNIAENEIDLSSKTILVVDDDDLNREIACTFLQDRGIKTETAENGQVAAELFAKSEAGHYDAILMDIRMPVMDGIEATKMIRGMDRSDAETIPIIAMSANAFDEDMQRSMESGMNSHLTKPMDIKKVIETLGKFWDK